MADVSIFNFPFYVKKRLKLKFIDHYFSTSYRPVFGTGDFMKKVLLATWALRDR